MRFLKLFVDLPFSRILVVGLVATVLYYSSEFDDGSALEAQIAAVNASINTETDKRAEIEKRMKREEEMRGNLMQLQRNLDVVKAKIPADFKNAQMSSIINSAAVISAVNIVELSADPSRSAGKPPIQAANLSTITPEQLVDEIVFKIKLNGSYDGLIKFLEALSMEDKVIKVRNFKISKNVQDNIYDDSIQFAGEVVGFKQVPVEGQTAAGGP